MPEVRITIGGRDFDVACQAGEEHYLEAAAALLDREAAALSDQIGRLPEARMLLMAGLMLADRTAGLEDKLRAAEAKIDTLEAGIGELQARPAPPPEKVEVAVLPEGVADTIAELAARAEALADAIEERGAAQPEDD